MDRLRRPEPFLLTAAACLLVGAGLYAGAGNPAVAATWAAIAAVLGGFLAGVAVGLADLEVPDRDYTAVGSVLVVLAFVGLAVSIGRPEGAYLVAVVGGIGAALVGLDSGRERAPTSESSGEGAGEDDTDQTGNVDDDHDQENVDDHTTGPHEDRDVEP